MTYLNIFAKFMWNNWGTTLIWREFANGQVIQPLILAESFRLQFICFLITLASS